MQVAFGLLKVGRYISYTPYAVISGFMSGIGAIIMMIETMPFIGHPPAAGGPLGALRELPELLVAVNFDALIVGATSLAVMILWPKKWRSIMPPPLAALVTGTLLAFFVCKGAPVIGDVPTDLPALHPPIVPLGEIANIIQPAFVLALLGSIDSLLTSLVADSITRTRHNSNKELIGQGIGNMAAGLIGAIPGAGATMRTVVSIRAGGTGPLAGALHAVILLALALGAGELAASIPHAALAGILMKVGWDIIDWGYLRRLRQAPRDKIFVMFVTLGLTVFVDLITAVAVGLILAGFANSRWMEIEELKGITTVALTDETDLTENERAELEKHHHEISFISLHGRFSYASARELTKRVGLLARGRKALILDFTHASHIDTSAAMAIDELINSAHAQKMHCILAGLGSEGAGALNALQILDHVNPENRVDTRIAAIRRAAQAIDEA